MLDKVWIVVKWISETAWEFQGVFSTEAKAVAACRAESYFIGPAVIDAPLPDAPEPWTGGYYPLCEKS